MSIPPLLLRNGWGHERNLCFCNSIIQLLRIVPEVKTILNASGNPSSIEMELMLIMAAEGTNSIVSAGHLRQLIGNQYGNQRYILGEQEDSMEFMNMLLQSLTLDIQNLFMFSMEKKFDFLYEGKPTCCINCGCRPRNCTDRQDILQLDIPDGHPSVFLTGLLHRHFGIHQVDASEGKRCSVCCVHGDSANHNSEVKCELKPYQYQTQIIHCPQYLMIQLKRFKIEAGQLLKVYTKVISCHIINVQNVSYNLIGILNHSGTVNAGHYTALLKYGNHWYRCNDSAYPTQVREEELFSSDNYTFLFKRQGGNGSTNRSTQFTSSYFSPNPTVPTSIQTHAKTQLVTCKGCSKDFKQLKRHLQNNESCKMLYDMDMLERNLAEEKKERDRLRKQAKRLQDKLQNEAKFNKKRADEKQAERNNKREIDLEQFKKKRAEEKRKERNVEKEQNLEQFKKKRAEEKRKERDVEKEQNLEQFKKKRAEEKRKERNVEKEQDLEQFKKKRAEMMRKERNVEKEQDLEQFKKKRAAEKRKERDVEKEQDLEQFKKKRAEEKRKERDVEKEQDLEQFKKKRAEERRKERNRKRDLDLATFQQTEATERQERRKTAKAVDVTKFNLKRAAAMKSWRLKQGDSTQFTRKQVFQDSIRDGRVYVCVSCQRKLYRISVFPLEENWKQTFEDKFPGVLRSVIGETTKRKVSKAIKKGGTNNAYADDADYICQTCHWYLVRGKMAPMSHQNNLQFVDITNHPELMLSELENQLIARNIIFQKIKLLPKSRWNVMVDKTINVPTFEDDILNSLDKLPRTLNEAGLVVVQLKRKLEYRSHHKEQYVDVKKIFSAIKTMKSMGNRFYQFIPDDVEFKTRCQETDPEGYCLLFGDGKDQGDVVQSTTTECSEENKHTDDEEESNEEQEYIEKDPIRRNQFNYNRSTCFADNLPEIRVENNTRNVINTVEVAPGENKVPTNIFQEKHYEEKSFPGHFPNGKNGKDEERPVKLRDQDYFTQRIMNEDERCAKDPAYIFAAAAFVESKQIARNINLSFQRGKKTHLPDGKCVYSLDDGYMVLDNIKNTPRYWQKARYELYARLENLGPFTFFFTLSCADIRWPENFTSLLAGHDITYTNKYGNDEIFVDSQPLSQFLEACPHKHELIKNNLLNATLNFQHRLKMFIKHIIMNKGSPLTISYYNYRIEFQLRGAPHAHGTLWMDWENFKVLPRRSVDSITHALNLIKIEQQISSYEKECLSVFADLFISCSLKHPGTKGTVKEVNVHHHTKRACQKYGGHCRFKFPKFPIHKTIISCPSKMVYRDTKEREKKMGRHRKFLEGVREVLEDHEIMGKVCEHKKYEMDRLEKEWEAKWKINQLADYLEFEKLSIGDVPQDISELLLDITDENGNVSLKDLRSRLNSMEDRRDKIDCLIKERVEYMLSFVDVDIENYDDVSPILQEYENALSVNNKGYSVVYKRDVNETMVNTYNPEWIAAWNGNIDFQLCLDFFAVITYISDYYSKDDSGTMQFLHEALRDCANEDQRTKLKKVASVFLTHRQMGESEAYYRILPAMHLKESNIQAVFAPTGFNPSRFLQKVDDDLAEQCENSITVEGREGTYQEKPSMYDKYLRRDCELQPEIKDLCYAQFLKRYKSASRIPKSCNFSQSKVDKSQDSNGRPYFKNDIITKHYESEDKVYKLPPYIHLKETRVGESCYMQLRNEVVLRFHKFKKDKNPHEYYFSELQLYYPHTNNEKDGIEYSLEKERDDLRVCQETFTSSGIGKVKKIIMPFLENVEEGIESARSVTRNDVGEELDPQNEQDRLEYEEEELIDNPEYISKHPDHVSDNDTTLTSTGLFKKVTLNNEEELNELTHQLDKEQRIVVEKGINFARRIMIARKTPIATLPPLLIIQGGAGSGKSTVINVLAQWIEKMLRQSGDNPEMPYVLKVSFTGTAAANIDGMTLHSAFNFNFGNAFLSLADKTRDKKREMLSKLKMVILDELSMLKADMLYQLDLRLRELKEVMDKPFGGCSVFLFGDILQLKPVMGRYIFEQPQCQDYHLSHTIDPLWQKFEVILLIKNHRQGEDHKYAEILNRIRTGNQTEEDNKVLEERVRAKDHHEIPRNALYITCKNIEVNKFNEEKLKNLDGDEYVIEANVTRGAEKHIQPKLQNDGSIWNTPLQNVLKLKVSAKVMLTYNVDVIDSLTNGAIGTVVGFNYTCSGEIKAVLVHFINSKVGYNKRKNYSTLQQRFPGIPVTPIEKIEFRFGMSKNPTSHNDIMTATQFPLKLSFACTAHKMQGSTVVKPNSLVLDLRSIREPAQAYVMLSRVQSVSQLFIVEQLPKRKIYPSEKAVKELKRMEITSINGREEAIAKNTVVVSLNIRSLSKHYNELSNDFKITCSKVIALQETWCSNRFDNSKFELNGYRLHLVNQGNGKGVAFYYRKEFILTGEVNEETFQMAKLSSNGLNIINIYRSQGANTSSFIDNLRSLIDDERPCCIVGDFNIDYLSARHPITTWICCNGFQQLVKSPTHVEGGLLDHVYVLKCPGMTQVAEAHLYYPYYSDHAAICLEQF